MPNRLLAHPLTRGLDLDDPRTTTLRRRIIQEKAFLRKLYKEWYDILASAIPPGPGAALELGSGAGFLREVAPEAIASEVFQCPDIQLVLDARAIPFAANSLRAILMVDVFHHIPDVEAFLREASRCLRPGGVIAMIEPWPTPWSRFVYRRLHHEPFEPAAKAWRLPPAGPLTGANGALPWIVFSRDHDAFTRLFPRLRVDRVTVERPFSYLASGGVSLRALAPGFLYWLFRTLERPLDSRLGCFAHICLTRL